MTAPGASTGAARPTAQEPVENMQPGKENSGAGGMRVSLALPTLVPTSPAHVTQSQTRRPQTARTHRAGEIASSSRVAPHSARDESKRKWAVATAGGAESDTRVASVAPRTPIRPRSELESARSVGSPRTARVPRPNSLVGMPSEASPNNQSRGEVGGFIQAAMKTIREEEYYRAKDYPETSHITPSPVGTLGVTRDMRRPQSARNMRSVSPTKASKDTGRIALVGLLKEVRDSASTVQLRHLDFWLGRVFSAKCLDLNIKPSAIRRTRFVHAIRSSSSSTQLNMSQAGLGPLAASAVAAMLLEIRHIQTFHSVNLSGNPLGDPGCFALAEMLWQNEAVTRLDLRSCGTGIEGGVAIFRAVECSSSLTDLDLGLLPGGGTRNRVGLKMAKHIALALANNPALTHLSFAGNGMGPQSAAIISPSLAGNTSLKQLDLRLNNLRDEGTGHLAAAFGVGAQLQHLTLSQNHIGAIGSASLAKAISSGNCFIQSLDLSFNHLNAKAIEVLASALVANSQLSALHLNQNPIGPVGATALACALNGVGRLSTLTLSKTALNDTGVEAIADKLHSQRTVSKLDLSNNGCGDPGAITLAAMLRNNSCLNSLCLNFNQVGDAGALALGQALTANTSLRVLQLRDNSVHDASAKGFVNALLQSQRSVIELDLVDNDISFANLEHVRKIVEDHAARWMRSAGTRLRCELFRLTKEASELPLREKQLDTLQAERLKMETEAARAKDEMATTMEFCVDNMDQLSQQLVEASAELAETKAQLSMLAQATEEVRKEARAQCQEAKQRLHAVQDQVRTRSQKRDKATAETSVEEIELVHSERHLAHEMTRLLARIQAATEAKAANVAALQRSFEEDDDAIQDILSQAPNLYMAHEEVNYNPGPVPASVAEIDLHEDPQDVEKTAESDAKEPQANVEGELRAETSKASSKASRASKGSKTSKASSQASKASSKMKRAFGSSSKRDL